MGERKHIYKKSLFVLFTQEKVVARASGPPKATLSPPAGLVNEGNVGARGPLQRAGARQHWAFATGGESYTAVIECI